jgi:predicted GTPase
MNRPVRTLILGAAGRDFHNFNMVFRDDPSHEVAAFTAQQIPHIADRRYPPSLAGPLYPDGIPIRREEDLEVMIAELEIDLCVMAYSDVSHEQVMHLASRANAAGSDFTLLSVARTALRSKRPVIAVVASRTGAGKSQTSRAVAGILRARGLSVAVVRHPMPYGDLEKQRLQRFETMDDLEAHDVTIEEREEYEPHIEAGSVVWAGVDYEAILQQAERESDVILWDGGNNDTPFYRSDLTIVVLDPLRAGDETRYHPGETNLRMADVVVINKIDAAEPGAVLRLLETVRTVRPGVPVIEAASPAHAEDPGVLLGRRVLVIEDGPTLTHGGMSTGAGTAGALRAGAIELVDPRPWAAGELASTFRDWPHLTRVLPAMGYGDAQIRDLETSIRSACEEGGAEAVAIGTPIDLTGLIEIPVPSTRIRYDLQVIGRPTLEEILERFPAPGD